MARTDDREYAAAKAGYKHPSILAGQLMMRPEVAEAVYKAQVARAQGDLTPKALDLWDRLMGDETVKPEVRLHASKLATNFAAQQLARAGDDLENLSVDELRRLHSLSEASLALRAKLVDGETVEAEPPGGVASFE